MPKRVKNRKGLILLCSAARVLPLYGLRRRRFAASLGSAALHTQMFGLKALGVIGVQIVRRFIFNWCVVWLVAATFTGLVGCRLKEKNAAKKSTEPVPGVSTVKAPPPRLTIKWVTGAYCPRSGDEMFTVRTTWRNDGDRPVRTVYATIRVFDKDGNLTSFGAVDHPIYSVPDTHPGIAQARPTRTRTAKDTLSRSASAARTRQGV